MPGYIRKEAARAGALRQVAVRRSTKWTAATRQRFLEELGATSNVAASARAAGVAESSAYRLRQKDAAFNEGWLAALAEGHARLEMMVLERALTGTKKPVWHGGREVGVITEYSDRLALSLLSAHHDAVKGKVAPPAVETKTQIADRLTARLTKMGERMRAAEARGDLAPMDEGDGGETAHELITGRKAGTKAPRSRGAQAGAEKAEARPARSTRS